MKKLLPTLSLLFLLISLIAQEDSSPLERALSGVVTVGVFDAQEEGIVYGFGQKEKSIADIAYENALDLTGAYSRGSGFVIEYEGTYYILTNLHVVDAASDEDNAISIYSISRKKYPVRLVGGDSFYDLAILTFDGVEPGEELQPLTFSEKETKLGQKVFAIGNPLGEYPYSVTDGIISGKNRLYDRPATGRHGFLQHTATMIWGNSGGPLVNEAGEVVGINTWIKTQYREEQQQSFLYSQLNFSLEGTLAASLIREMLGNEDHRLHRAYLGIEFATNKGYTDFDPESAPFIKGLLEDSPAQALLTDRVGYTVLRINDQPVATLQDIVRIMESVDPGQEVTLKLKKGINAPEITIPAAELTPKQLEQVAQYFFRNYSAYEARDSSDSATLIYEGEGRPYIERMQPGEDPKPAEGAPLYTVAAAGRIDAYGRTSLSRIQSLQDLGVVIRLSTMEGHIGALLSGEAEEPVENVRFYLIDEEMGYIIRTLYY